MNKPTIFILATGGTIAGVADSNNKDMGYEAGVLPINLLIKPIMHISDVVNIEYEQIVNIDSSNMTNDILLKLAKRINVLSSESHIDGIVVTHGTDTMEESALFLHLTIKTIKPVVLVGAMRPSTSLSADGPKNLHNAILLASSNIARNNGVLITMNDKIYSARDIVKVHTMNLDAFRSNRGEMGYIIDGNIFLYHTPYKKHTVNSIFDVSCLNTLPKVDILYSYCDDGSSVAAHALFKSGTKGLVVAGTGLGNIHINHKKSLEELIKRGLIVVVSSRVESGFVMINKEDSDIGFISSHDLNPQKARILLMLALTIHNDYASITNIFNEY